eukprot:CAMPEP_0181069552 /NCGR_PEP_ID=MMETSP1070-20121207/27007_1 /TAXON_ID=265543 /ORGANISM="Minutocellus polymorphus, Strain NH13" /LENGTH=508 /DNA_ID=CAMNT_0023150365 /DNA_START=1 /DNA_END=1527 /DNA_ORIENTATION=-
MTHRLRACPGLVGQNSGASTGMTSAAANHHHNPDASGGGGLLEIGGTYAALTWIDLDEERAGNDDLHGGCRDVHANASHGTTSGSTWNRNSSDVDVGSSRQGGSGRKRTRTRGGRCSSNASQTQRHLHVDIRINDEPAAQILLCSARVASARAAASAAATASASASAAGAAAGAAARASPPASIYSPLHSQHCSTFAAASTSSPYHHEDPIQIASFSYLLLRGRLKAAQPVLLYLESTLGCAVGARPFTPSPADVAASLSDWMVGTVVIGSDGGGGGVGGNNIGDMGGMSANAAAANTKPLELTLAIPPHLVRAGLERITVTVPPVSLTRLCAAVERNRSRRPSSSSCSASASASGRKGGSSKATGGAITPLMVTDSEKDDESSGYRAGFGAGAAAAASAATSGARDGRGTSTADRQQLMSSATDNHVEEEEEELPILRALQCYLYEAFHIDARQLHVVKAATAHAVVGTDGRIKPLTVEALPSLLEDIGMMIRHATGARGGAASTEV